MRVCFAAGSPDVAAGDEAALTDAYLEVARAHRVVVVPAHAAVERQRRPAPHPLHPRRVPLPVRHVDVRQRHHLLGIAQVIAEVKPRVAHLQQAHVHVNQKVGCSMNANLDTN